MICFIETADGLSCIVVSVIDLAVRLWKAVIGFGEHILIVKVGTSNCSKQHVS
jgi:hypothetical protein